MANLSKYRFIGAGLEKDEKKLAKKLFDDYRKHYSIDTLSDLQLLESLVYREIIQVRYKKKIEDISKSETVKAKNIIPNALLEYLDGNLAQILILKEKLGLFSKNKEKDPYEYLTQLEHKFKKHRQENAGDYTIPCPFCSKMIFLMFKVKDYEAKKHPFFKGKFLTNDYLWKLYKEEKISAKDLAKVFQTSTDYITWLDKHIYKAPDTPSK